MFRKLISNLLGDGVVTDDAAVSQPRSSGKSSAERREMPPPLELPSNPAEQLKVLLLNGRKIEAIKVYRDMTGMGLAEAKADIDALEQELQQSEAVAQQQGHSKSSTNDQMEQVYALIEAGNKIAAIKRYREITGVGLAEAKEAVEALEQGERPSHAPLLPPPVGETLVSAMPIILNHLKNNQKINAIKLYREVTGVGLKEAKDEIDVLERQLRGRR